jgi:hypothetical protein
VDESGGKHLIHGVAKICDLSGYRGERGLMRMPRSRRGKAWGMRAGTTG